jgi:hypothetical protein
MKTNSGGMLLMENIAKNGNIYFDRNHVSPFWKGIILAAHVV